MSMIGNYFRVRPERLAELRSNPGSIVDFLYPGGMDPPDGHLDIDKTWHAIHFLLNGHAWEGEPPMLHAVLGGEAIGDVEVGYGPARAVEPVDVQALAGAMSDVSSAELLDRFDAGAMNDADVYPGGWSGDGNDQEYIASHYRRLVEFVRAAAQAGDAVIEYLN